MARKNGVAGEQERAAAPLITSGDESLPAETCLHIHQIMVRARTMEERMIKMSKSGQGFFWIGGPGEEAFNTCLGLLVKKGEGPPFDYLHLHYRNSACLIAMGMTVLDGIRQMAMKVTDPHSMGRNFSSHFARREWNILPVKSVIQSQFVIAPGTAWVQKRLGGDGITIVIGGDAGTAEGDFASCMVWCTRPSNELPVLMIVTNNGWGISTPASTQHGEQHITDRGRAFGIQGEVVNGNDPITSWHSLQRAMGYVRNMRRPYMLEARLSRLHGHSSSSGAGRVANETDCIALLEKKLLDAGVIDRPELARIHELAEHEAEQALEQALREPDPTPDHVPKHTYADSPVDAVYPGDYTGLPE